MHVIPILRKEWKVSFELMPTKFFNGWRNVFHAGDPRLFGSTKNYSGSPSVFIKSKWTCPNFGSCSSQPEGIRFRFHANGQIKHHDETQNVPQLNQWTKIEVNQMLEGRYYKLKISVNNVTRVSITNFNPQKFEGVNVYASNPWYRHQHGKVRNLIISSPQTGEHQNQWKASSFVLNLQLQNLPWQPTPQILQQQHQKTVAQHQKHNQWESQR